jgi:hypothetical protein
VWRTANRPSPRRAQPGRGSRAGNQLRGPFVRLDDGHGRGPPAADLDLDIVAVVDDKQASYKEAGG